MGRLGHIMLVGTHTCSLRGNVWAGLLVQWGYSGCLSAGCQPGSSCVWPAAATVLDCIPRDEIYQKGRLIKPVDYPVMPYSLINKVKLMIRPSVHIHWKIDVRSLTYLFLIQRVSVWEYHPARQSVNQPAKRLSKHETSLPTSVQYWATVYDSGPTLNRHWANVSRLLGSNLTFSWLDDSPQSNGIIYVQASQVRRSSSEYIGKVWIWLQS